MSSSVDSSSAAPAKQYTFAPITAPQESSALKLPPSSPHARLAAFAARQHEPSVNSFCGAVAGIASGIVTCPLDVIKTKLQAQGGYRPKHISKDAMTSRPAYQGMFGTANVIWRQDGLRGMYRGLGPMLLGYLPTWSVYMSVYGAARDYYYTRVDNKWLAQLYASVTAGACSSITTNPIWVIKTRLMSQVGSGASKDTRTPWHYHNTLDAFRKMYRTEGIGAFYSGLGPALLGLTHVAIQFPLYEFFKKEFTGVEFGAAAEQDTGSHTAGVLGATFLSKICATSATYPHEVLRTRLQTQQRKRAIERHSMSDPTFGAERIVKPESPRYHGIWYSCRVILREEGWRAFYYGMGTNLIRAVPSAMTTMLTFETVKSAIQRLQVEGRQYVSE
ncbi:MAG: hypothetical protein Q9162_006895 [Coniocarpon cinnabarinum]